MNELAYTKTGFSPIKGVKQVPKPKPIFKESDVIKIRNMCMSTYNVTLKAFSGKGRRSDLVSSRFLFGYIMCEIYCENNALTLTQIARYVKDTKKHYDVIYWRDSAKSRFEMFNKFGTNSDFYYKYKNIKNRLMI